MAINKFEFVIKLEKSIKFKVPIKKVKRKPKINYLELLFTTELLVSVIESDIVDKKPIKLLKSMSSSMINFEIVFFVFISILPYFGWGELNSLTQKMYINSMKFMRNQQTTQL